MIALGAYRCGSCASPWLQLPAPPTTKCPFCGKTGHRVSMPPAPQSSTHTEEIPA